MDDAQDRVRIRREPPSFRAVRVVRSLERTPFLVRVTLGGEELAGLRCDEPAASVRLLLPEPGADELVLPIWNGNEFLAADGSRPPIRTLTPLELRVGGDGAPELDVEVVLHGDAPLSTWARSVGRGAPAALSGPGRGYEVDTSATSFLVVGDESAAPAMGTLLPHLPPGARTVLVHEVQDAAAALDWPALPGGDVRTVVRPAGGRPGDAALDAVRAVELAADTRIWGAGEAAGVQRLRRHLLEERGVPRSRMVVRGYWKVDRRPRTATTGTPARGPV
ncbi:MAG: siderophore-interacting protein [Microthrixaceae bacterium]